MKATQDFNYKVALASGLKSLQAGRLRQAEEQFRFLVDKFPAYDSGHRGLAKVLVELEDRPAAAAALREGASALAKSGQRDTATALLREAVGLDPADLSAHRRLFAVLSLSGDENAAAAEVERYVLVAPDAERARLEIAYALERLPHQPRLLALAGRTNVQLERAPAPVVVSGKTAAEIERELSAEGTPVEPEPDQRLAAIAQDPRVAALGVRPVLDEPAPYEAAEDEAGPQADVEVVREAIAVPQAARGALEEAREHLEAGRLNAASDVLLELIATGRHAHDAQRLLGDVARGLGRRDLADAKTALLAEVEALEAQQR